MQPFLCKIILRGEFGVEYVKQDIIFVWSGPEFGVMFWSGIILEPKFRIDDAGEKWLIRTKILSNFDPK